MISIAMTTYNGERFLREQLDSILAQTVTDWELHVCDDCSTDSTCAILEEYANRDSRIHLHLNEHNLGFKKNFEKAISFCIGEYIALSDQDDVWLPFHLEKLLANLGDKSLSGGNAILIDSNGNEMNRMLNEADGFMFMPKDSLFLYRILLLSGPIQGASQLIRKSFLQKCLPIPKEVKYHDAWFIACACLDGGIAYTFDSVSKYRQHGGNITFAMHNPQKKSVIEVLKIRARKFLKGVETDRFCYIEELSKRFGTSDKNFSDIKTFYEHVKNHAVKFSDIKLIWKNFENITTQKGHRHFIRKFIAWTKLCPPKEN